MSISFLPATPVSVDATILSRVIDPQRAGLSSEVAHSMLKWEFDGSDRRRMAELAEKAREGTLDEHEQELIDGFVRVGNLISLIHAQAKLSLKRQGND
jgi:uncharacterized protein YggL (DUF469 family)